MNTITDQPNPEAKPITAQQFSASLLAKNRKQLLEIASGLNLTIDPQMKNHQIIAAIMDAKNEAGDFASGTEPETNLAPSLAAALDEVIFQNPGPSPHPTSDKFIEALHLHYANSEIFAPFKSVPDCMVGTANWNDLTKPSTKAALLAEVELLPPEKLARLKELAAEHGAAIAEQIKYSPTAALRDHDAQRTNLHQSASDRAADISGNKFHSRETIQREYHEKCGAIAERMKLIVKEAYPLAKEAVLAAESALEDFLRNVEEGERVLAAGYDLDWNASRLWKAAAVNLMTIRNKIRSYTGRPDQGPEQMLDGLLGINWFNLK
jgi:hypothetical protein